MVYKDPLTCNSICCLHLWHHGHIWLLHPILFLFLLFFSWLYSDRTEHFCGRGAQILTKLLGVGSDMEKLISSHPEPSLVIRVYKKCQKTKKCEKSGFWGFFSNSSKTVKSIFFIFWHRRPLTNTKRLGGKFFWKLASFLRKH